MAPGLTWRNAMNIEVRQLAFALFATALASASSQAQNYPTRPVRLIVGYPAGGGTDIAARIVATKLSESLGQQVLVDNRPGDNSNVAASMVAKAAPDGYLIFMMS